MKRFLSFIVTFLTGVVISLQAQGANPVTNPGSLQQTLKDGNGERLVAGLLVQEMKSQLNLTDAQVKQVTPLFEDKVTAMQNMREDSTSSQQMKSIVMAFNTKVDAILTPEQRAKWKGYQEDLMEKAKERHDDLMQKVSIKAVPGAVVASGISIPPASPNSSSTAKGGAENYGAASPFIYEMKDQLNLTDSQIKKVIPIFQERLDAWGSIQKNPALTPDQKNEQSLAATKSCLARVDAVLTPAQRSKRDVLIKKHIEALKSARPPG